MKITKKIFLEMTGRNPQFDDLEISNCKKSGESGHYNCGICEKCNKPRLTCGHIKINRS